MGGNKSIFIGKLLHFLHNLKKMGRLELPYFAGLSSPGVPGGPPDFGRSANTISTRRSRLCPPHYYRYPRIFKPSYGPASYYSDLFIKRTHLISKQGG